MENTSMLYLVFIAMFLFGSVIGWLVVYFVRKYKEYTPKVLRDTALLFLGGVCLESLLGLMYKNLFIVALMAYIIGVAVGFFIHWIYQLIIAKITAPKFMDPRSKYNLFLGCSLPDESKNKTSHTAYMLECINKGYGQLCHGLIFEEEFKNLIRNTGLSKEMFEDLTGGYWGDMYLFPDLTAYIKAKGLLNGESS